jgi:hypothetical protein
VNAAAFARVLSDRFRAVVPAGFHVEAEGPMIWFRVDQGLGYWGGSAGSHAVEHFFSDSFDAPLEDRATMAADFALNDLQDYVDEESTEPWPARTPRGPARPHAEVRSGELHMWFGDEGNEALKLEPVDLDPVTWV